MLQFRKAARPSAQAFNNVSGCRTFLRILRAMPLVLQELEDDYGGFMVQVMSGGSVEFTGEMAATGLRNMRSVFSNNVGGSIE